MSFEQIAYNIKFFREQKNWTQQKLADQLVISRSTVTKWENNQLTPDINSLMKLSSVFNVTLDHLVGNKLYQEDILLEFKRIYRSEAVSFDDEAVELVEYIMKFPDFKQQIYRLKELSIKKQLSIHQLLKDMIDQYELM
ncbi:helix-turn-helix domain-containing protein [Oceanobacillus sp. CAU 1775]